MQEAAQNPVTPRPALRQGGAQVRFDWGLTGALALTQRPATAAVVVDVLSFSTSVSVAGDLGIETFPFRWRDARATEFAKSMDATLAGGRRQGRPSLSPASIRAAAWRAPSAAAEPHRRPAPSRLVLPSPNGSSICLTLAEQAIPVLAGCLRNATAIAHWLAHALATGRLAAVGIVAAGERWPDGSLRPAAEDLWGAGAVLARLAATAPELRVSPEARAAAAAFSAVEPDLAQQLAGCASGLELVEDGFAEDVTIAAELDGSSVVPLLLRDRFEPQHTP
ncbi:MAG: 2-phosphosulfolactate phosphatase [Jatrophihabitantaceae bacterium]